MDVNRIVAELDTEISRLQKIREALTGMPGAAPAAETKGRRGRPKGSTNKPAASAAAPKRKRNLSPEGRKAIADAMKRRWAERRKDAPKKEASKKDSTK